MTYAEGLQAQINACHDRMAEIATRAKHDVLVRSEFDGLAICVETLLADLRVALGEVEPVKH